jgi:hypothetical protein
MKGIVSNPRKLMVPAQYIAKQYTEFLGRAPSFQEISAVHGSFPCSTNALAQYSRSVLSSPEYRSHGLSLRDTVRALYRGLLNREPDQSGWDWYSQFSEGEAFNAIVASQEYRTLVNRICSSKGEGYGWGQGWFNPTVSFANIKHKIESASPGTVIELGADKIAVTSTIVVPPGVVVRGRSGHYLQQPNFYRATSFNGPIFRLRHYSALEYLHIDGRKNYHPNGLVEAVNVEITGTGARVHGLRTDNPAGWTSILCNSISGVYNTHIVGNLVISYGNPRRHGEWTDGLSLACEQSLAIWNTVVDASDVGIILFDTYSKGNASQVKFNRVLQLGNHSWGMIGLDQQVGNPKFFGSAAFQLNELYTAPHVRTRVGIVDGTRTWYGTVMSRFTSPQYFNYGGINVELFGTVGDNGFVYQPSLSVNLVPFTPKPGCTPRVNASALVHRVDQCLL